MRFLQHGESVKQVSGLPLIGFTFLTTELWSSWYESQFRIQDFLLEQGADPNENFEGCTMWQYFISYLHTWTLHRPSYSRGSLMRLMRSLESFMKSGADLDICCINDAQIWEQVYGYDLEGGDLHGDFGYLKPDLQNHVISGTSTDTDTESWASIDSETITSTSSTGPPSITDRGEISESDGDSIDENEKISFEERHSLTAIFKDVFETEDDPHGADELLELMASLKAAKKASEGMQP